MANMAQSDMDAGLIRAAKRGDEAMLKILLRIGAQPDAGAGTASPALVEAAAGNHVNCIQVLLAAGARIDAANSKGSTALMLAAFHGQTSALKVLLDAGADRHIKNRDGGTALGYAGIKGNADVIRLLKETPDEIVNITRVSNRTLEEIFNFRTLERISLIRKAENEPVEAVYRESFTQIETLPALRKAFEEHVRRGGKRTPDEIFPHSLHKPASLKRRPR